MKKFAPLFVGLILLLTGCQGMKPEQFAGQEPTLRIEDYFDGRTRAWGIFQDRFGQVHRQFTVDIEGRQEDGELVLDEQFVYADGETDERIWRIQKTDDHTYIGRADDVVGEAQGRSFGNALNWRYTLALPVADRIWNVEFDDWMFLQPDGVLINRAEVTKFGIKVGEVTLVFRKVESD
jgi:hypothetical protein